MDLVQHLILQPEENHLGVMSWLIVFLEFMFVAFVGVAVFSTLLSVAHRRSNEALARDFAHVIPARFEVWLTLGLLPLVTLMFLFGQFLYGTKYDMLDAMLKIAPLAVTGLIALYFYRHSLHLLVGALGLVLMAAFLLPFGSLLDLMNRPEFWPLVDPLTPNIYNIQAVARIAIFGAFSLLATGASLLFIYFVWPERKLPADAPHAAALRNWALALTLAGALALPALMVWDAAILPFGARSYLNLKIVIGLTVLFWLTGLFALGMLLNQNHRRAVFVSVLALVALWGEVARQQVVRETAMSDKLALQRLNAEEKFALEREAQEKRYASNTPIDPAMGEKVYNEKCASCHKFDQKVVGPPYYVTVPKYNGDKAKIVEFVLNPVKVDPGFPSMPKPGLTRREARAVVEFIVKKVEEQKK